MMKITTRGQHEFFCAVRWLLVPFKWGKKGIVNPKRNLLVFNELEEEGGGVVKFIPTFHYVHCFCPFCFPFFILYVEKLPDPPVFASFLEVHLRKRSISTKRWTLILFLWWFFQPIWGWASKKTAGGHSPSIFSLQVSIMCLSLSKLKLNEAVVTITVIYTIVLTDLLNRRRTLVWIQKPWS